MAPQPTAIAAGVSSITSRLSRQARIRPLSSSLASHRVEDDTVPPFVSNIGHTPRFVPRVVDVRPSRVPPVRLSPEDRVRVLATRKPTPLTLQAMYRYASADNTSGGRLRNAQFLHRELPVRIAQRVLDLRALPGGLGNSPAIRAAADVYVDYVERFRSFPVPASVADEERFTAMLEELVLDRMSVPCAIAKGLRSLKDGRRSPARFTLDIDAALYKFFTARVGMRFLTEHHVLSSPRWTRARSPLLDADPYYYGSLYAGREEPGCIQRDCDALAEAKSVADDVSARVRAAYGGACPEIIIVNAAKKSGGIGKKTLGGAKKRGKRPFTYVPHHLRYMLEKLLKNACVATLKRHHKPASLSTPSHSELRQRSLSVLSSQMVSSSACVDAPTLPPVTVVIVKGAEDVTIKIADNGGGVPRSSLDDLFTFANCTPDLSSPDPTMPTAEIGVPPLGSSCDFNGISPMGGPRRGFGLPLTRVYARYFGGDLTVKSMEGHGLDIYLHLPVLGSACENLNEAVRFSPGNLDSNPRYGSGQDALALLATRAL